MSVATTLRRLKAGATARAPWIPGVHQAGVEQRRRRRRAILQHEIGLRWPEVPSEIVPDKEPTDDDVAIARRLLAAFRTGSDSASRAGRNEDLWTLIAAQQENFAGLLRRGNADELAAYLCNVARQDASIGIVQGDSEYARLTKDASYRRFVAVMAKDKLVSLAEALGVLPVENPEAGVGSRLLYEPLDDAVAGISEVLGITIAPPDVDGGMLKYRTSHGLFGERDVNALFTARLLSQAVRTYVAPRICEIGAGSGRVPYWLRQLQSSKYTIIDLPHVNVVQGYYLLKALPATTFRLYGEPAPAEGDEPDVTIWPHALEQRCTVHALRNVTGKLPERHHQEVKARWWKAFDEARSPGEATRELQGIIADYRTAYPSAMAVIETDLPALVTHLRFPSEHRKRIRTTNLLERTFVEVRRRTKVIGPFPGETSALTLIWAVLELSSRGWRGVNMNPKTVAEIERLRRQLREDPASPVTIDAEEVIAA